MLDRNSWSRYLVGLGFTSLPPISLGPAQRPLPRLWLRSFVTGEVPASPHLTDPPEQHSASAVPVGRLSTASDRTSTPRHLGGHWAQRTGAPLGDLPVISAGEGGAASGRDGQGLARALMREPVPVQTGTIMMEELPGRKLPVPEEAGHEGAVGTQPWAGEHTGACVRGELRRVWSHACGV